ncbi:hypothetical protein [Fredinandcohnia onubensis]|uniref:hypothetical protein n=1 Tax=Fredinandcohnia onubensis TaxID=1571209 RepID=UPI000C0BFA87|nr:hypothetical protein [Fredinandcohnia onubensis]
MKQINIKFFIIFVLFLSGCNIKEATPEVVEDSEYINSISSFHFSHKEVAVKASRATIYFLNTQNGKDEYKTALEELKESTKQVETLPIPTDESELKAFDDIYRNAILQLPDSLESIVNYKESGDRTSLDAAINKQTQLGADIDFAAQQIFARRR